jgi:hypothetical protein
MVSALWKACSDGDLENVHQSLKEASVVDIEIKGIDSPPCLVPGQTSKM